MRLNKKLGKSIFAVLNPMESHIKLFRSKFQHVIARSDSDVAIPGKQSVYARLTFNPRIASYLAMTGVVLCFVLVFSSCTQSEKTKSIVINKSKVDSISVIEIIKHKGSNFDQKKLLEICKGYKVKQEDIRVWNDRIVILARKPNLQSDELEYWLRTLCANAEMVFFTRPFYIFSRQHCDDKNVAKQWENIILTANLVADPKMQQEYLNYHATQFQQWPEVSNGFCNAGFQQLLVFKSGRQLMLVISIPKGESLDKLNPLTTKNNPRVDEWNKLMSKYQEGIPGTKKGETWVFLKPVK